MRIAALPLHILLPVSVLTAGEGAVRPPMADVLRLPVDGWRESSLQPPDRAAERARITAAGERFVAAIAKAREAPSEQARQSVAAMVALLHAAAPESRPDELSPAFARRAVRGGALRRLGVDATELEQAVAAATQPTPVAVWTGPQGARLEERRDAFGVGGWVLTGQRTAYAVPHPRPQFLPMPDLTLVVDLPARADVQRDAAKAVSAGLFLGGTEIATWTAKEDRVVADAPAWRSAVPEPQGQGVAPGLFPPHIVLASLVGDPLRLTVAGGSVAPPRDGGAAEGKRFVADAAKALPDAAALDLIGQYLFRYVFDSPDPRFPMLVGNRECKGDIHQTAGQILEAVTCGQVRGDCDDLAELYQTIAERQGRLGHLLILPSHTAFAAARRDGQDWVVEVMQTGPTMAFRDPVLPEALRRAHAAFDPTAPFSPDQLGLLLRFSGENQRGPFRLGWRIFSEAAYARTMIDVQRDWQYQTYARAIAKMEKLIADGDRDPANYTELAGLYRATGQWVAAAREFPRALEGVTDPVSRIGISLELAQTQRQAGDADAARRTLAGQVQALRDNAKKLGNGAVQFALRISLAQLAAGDAEAARRTLMGGSFAPMAMLTANFANMVSQPGFDRARWSGDGSLAPVRNLLRIYIATLIAHLERATPAARESDPTLKNARQVVDLWLAKLAFLDADAPVETLPIYATAARIHALDLGEDELAKAVAAASGPPGGARDHLARPAAPAAQSREADLPWIRIAPAWWQQRLGRALRGAGAEAGLDEEEGGMPAPLDPATVDRAGVAAAAAGARMAQAACAAIGLSGQAVDWPAHFAVLQAAIVAGDDAALRERLRYVKQQGDKRLRDATAGTLGQMAPLCDAARWQAVLKAWADEVDYKPKWFSIAWVAVVVGAPQQGLAAAKMAASRFKDDRTFAEEAVFMEKLLGSARK